MRTLAPLVAVLVLLCVPGQGQGYFVTSELETGTSQEIVRLTKELYQARLGQIALFIDRYSEGKSRLLIGLGASAEPRVGIFMRPAASGQMPFITIYPASSPVSVKLEGIGRCELLGAVALGVEATAAEGDDKDKGVVAKPDVYLLAYGRNDGWVNEARLISLAVDDEGHVKPHVILRTLADRPKVNRPLGPPGVVVEFPGAGEVSEDNPAWRASVSLDYSSGVGYRLALDLRIIMK